MRRTSQLTILYRDLGLFADELSFEIINNTIAIRSFLPLIRSGKPGKIIAMSSVIGSLELAAGMPALADAYSVSRAALNMLIRKWGGVLKMEGIATACIHPGRQNPRPPLFLWPIFALIEEDGLLICFRMGSCD